jgi:hypothetical protein
MNLNTGGNQADLAFFRGNQLTPEQVQSRIDAGQGYTVHESAYGYYYDKMFVGGQSKLNWDAAALSEGSGTQATTSSSHSEEDRVTSHATEKPLPAFDLKLAPGVEKLEELAGQLETAADELKAKYDNAAVDNFEVAAGKVARAAEEVRENPTDEAAIEEFETATDELKNAAHTLEGEIGDEKYQKIVTAVDGFETAADHMLAADDGEADMAGAVSKALDALSSLLDATVSNSMAELLGLKQVADNFKSYSNDLSENLDSPQVDAFETATVKFGTAADQLIKNSSNQDTINVFETTANELKSATRALEGQIPEDIFQQAALAVNEILPSRVNSSTSTLGTDGVLFQVSDLNIQPVESFAFNSGGNSIDSVVNTTAATGPALELTGHNVGGIGPVHTAIKYTDEAGEVTFLSAGPENGINGSNIGFLTGGLNRDGEDANFHVSDITPPEGQSFGEYFDRLVDINTNYDNQLDYDLFPELFPDEGFNSNSFVFGLLEGTGGKVDADPADFKGGSTPIPVVNDEIIVPPASQNGSENPIVDGASAVVDTVSTGATAVGNAIVDGASAVVDTVSTGATAVGNAIVDGASAVVDTVSSGINSIGRGLSNIGSSIGSGISSIGSSIGSGISSIGSSISSGLSSIGGFFGF